MELARGFTLVELVIGIVVMGIAVAGITSVLFSFAVSSANPVFEVKSSLLAERVFREILSVTFLVNWARATLADDSAIKRAPWDTKPATLTTVIPIITMTITISMRVNPDFPRISNSPAMPTDGTLRPGDPSRWP